MTDVGDILHREHLQTLEALNALEQRTTGRNRDRPLSAADDDDRKLLEAVLAVLDHDVDYHFRFEEEDLFPALAGAGSADMVELLIREHEAIRPLVAELKKLAGRILEGAMDAEVWQAFRYAALDVVNSVLFHVQKEELSLIRRLGFLLPSDVDQALARRYVETPLPPRDGAG